MHKHHTLIVSHINRDPLVSCLVRDYFSLPRSTHIIPSLLDRKLSQADLVLCLLRLRDRHSEHKNTLALYIARLIGQPIKIGVPCLTRYGLAGAPQPLPPATLAPSRKILWVAPANPRQPGTEAYLRWREFRPGRTEQQLRVRGITRRDIRRAERAGWIRFEERA